MIEAGYLGLFVACFLSATIIPFGSEPVLTAMIYGDFNVVWVVVVATLGNWIGSIVTYYMGYIGNMDRIERWLRISPDKTQRYREVTQRYGMWLGLLVWLPGVGDVIAVCLGLLRTPPVPTFAMILAGKALRYALWAYLSLKGIELIA